MFASRPWLCLFAFCILAALPSCQVNSAFKPRAAQPSAFLGDIKLQPTNPNKSPFIASWTNPSKSARKDAKTRTELWIAPVDTSHLRPITKIASQLEAYAVDRKKQVPRIAKQMQERFAAAFKKADHPHYQIVEEPTKNSLTLELALVELNPNPVTGGIARNVIRLLGPPGMGVVLANVTRPLKGNIAIEGILRDSSTKEVLYAFADREESKNSLVVSVYDFTPYSYAGVAVREWARQFEALTRTDPEKGEPDSTAFTVLPF